MDAIRNDAYGSELSRLATFDFTLYSAGKFAGKLGIVAHPMRGPRPNVSSTPTRGVPVGTIRVKEREVAHGRVIEVVLHVENKTPDGSEFTDWFARAKTALAEKYPGVEVVLQS